MDATELQKQMRALFYLLEEGVTELQQTLASLKVKQQRIQQGLADCEQDIFGREEATPVPVKPFRFPKGPLPHDGNGGGGQALAQ
ncbi:MAG: hypothetical protein V3S82_01330 [Dehalococcoidia bacterium]